MRRRPVPVARPRSARRGSANTPPAPVGGNARTTSSGATRTTSDGSDRTTST